MNRVASGSHVLVVGSLNADSTLVLERAPMPGETLAASAVVRGLGGKGSNQAAACASAGARVVMIGAVGDDDGGRALISHLKELGIDVGHILTAAGSSTGEAFILSYGGGENSIAVHTGANNALSPGIIESAASAFDTAGLLVVQCEVPSGVVDKAITMAVARQIPVLIDPAPVAGFRRSWLRHAAYLTPNLGELAALAGIPVDSREAVERAARSLLAEGVGCVLAKRGGDGVLVVTEGGANDIAATPVTAIDTTGAGDMFAGAFAAALVEGQHLLQAAAFANVAAALSTLTRGAAESFPDRAAVLQGLGHQLPMSWSK